MSLFLLSAPLNGCVMDSSEDGVSVRVQIGKKKKPHMVFSVEKTEYRMLITWEMEEFDRSRKLFHSRARTHGRRWRSQRPAARATVRVALPELGPRQVGSWPRQ